MMTLVTCFLSLTSVMWIKLLFFFYSTCLLIHDIYKKPNYASPWVVRHCPVLQFQSPRWCIVEWVRSLVTFQMPDDGSTDVSLVKSDVPRFCDAVRHAAARYGQLFRLVFNNPTFRVYHVTDQPTWRRHSATNNRRHSLLSEKISPVLAKVTNLSTW